MVTYRLTSYLCCMREEEEKKEEVRNSGSQAAAATRIINLIRHPSSSSPLTVLCICVKGDYVVFNTGNEEKLSYSQADGLAWLYLAVA